MQAVLFTFGYGNEKSPKDRLFEEMNRYGIETMFDVRERAYSYGRPAWNARNMQLSSEDAGLCYVHVPSLGNKPVDVGEAKPKRLLPWSRLDSYKNGLDLVVSKLIFEGKALILCSEHQAFDGKKHNCHRVEVAHEIHRLYREKQGKDLQIVHLLPKGASPVIYSTKEDVEKFDR